MNTTTVPLTATAVLLRLLLLAGLAVGVTLCTPARAAQPLRLDRVAIVRFSDAGNNRLRVQSAVLDIDGNVTPRVTSTIDRPANTPPWALDRNVITSEVWHGYYNLGAGALANFTLLEGSVQFALGDAHYHFVGVAPDASTATGQLINLSTRARLATGGDFVIGGFVIEGRDQLVLVRVVGPSLTPLGVTDAAPDPALSLRRGAQTIHVNDNWSTHAAAGAVRLAASRVGAFPLAEGSKDAARLLRLQPGVYSVFAETSALNRTGGTILLEVYGVPDANDYEFVTTAAES
jgi:hypothetical protein